MREVTHDELAAALDTMILSVSGWRGIFAQSGEGEDSGKGVRPAFLALAVLASEAFAEYLGSVQGKPPRVILGRDTRPTGEAVAEVMVKALLALGVDCEYLGAAAIPEVIAFGARKDGFIYISASHNPIGHNGLKFGVKGGGVLGGKRAAALIALFRDKCLNPSAAGHAAGLVAGCPEEDFRRVFESPQAKQRALSNYSAFTRRVANNGARAKEALKNASSIFRCYFDRPQFRSNSKSCEKLAKGHDEKHRVFQRVPKGGNIAGFSRMRFSIAADFNGSARSASIDKAFFKREGVNFYAINDTPGEIVHGIIPEGENLEPAARFLEALHAGECGKYPGKRPNVLLAYTCDCDGDRGNFVYFDEKESRAKLLSAQEVFALAVVCELSMLPEEAKKAVVCNGPTSLRIDAIARAFGAEVFRAETGEANVVDLAAKKRRQGYTVRISGEGSNGGSVIYPGKVRDPLNTVLGILKFLLGKGVNRWRALSGHSVDGPGLAGLVASLPAYTTTGTAEARAKLFLRERDHALLKRNFQREFEAWWEQTRGHLGETYGVSSWTAVSTLGTEEKRNIPDFGLSGTGGLKILFRDSAGESLAFMWMRGSRTESVFRVLCDAQDPALEPFLLSAERSLLQKADSP